MIHQPRHRTGELAGLHRLLRGAGQTLAPLHVEAFAFGLAERCGRRCSAFLALLRLRPLLHLLFTFAASAPTLLLAFILGIVEMLIHGLVVVVLVEAGIDLLGGHVLELRQIQRTGRRLQSVAQQQRVNSEIAGHVPAPLVAMPATRKVREPTVQGLVRQHELRLLQRERVYVVGVVVEPARVGRRGVAPLGIARHHRQPQYQRAEKRLVEDEPRRRGGEFGFDIAHGDIIGKGCYRVNRIQACIATEMRRTRREDSI